MVGFSLFVVLSVFLCLSVFVCLFALLIECGCCVCFVDCFC